MRGAPHNNNNSMSSLRYNPVRRETSNPPVSAHSRSNPRHIKIERKDNGFGFTLRHFIVYPSEDGSDGGPPIQVQKIVDIGYCLNDLDWKSFSHIKG